MGNYCRYLGESSNNSSRRPRKRICYQSRDNTWRNIAQVGRNLTTQVDAEGITTSDLEGKINEIAHTLHVPLPEFISTVSQYRPVGISDEDWERFVSSVTLEFFSFGHNEQEKGTLVEKSKFAISASNSPSLASIDAVMGMSTKEYTPTLSDTESVSSAAFAGRFVLPDISDHECSTGSTSVWSLNSESSSLSQLNPASVRCLKQFTGVDEVRAHSEELLNSRCTTLCLKDLPSNSYEENLFYYEDKMSTPTRSPVTHHEILVPRKCIALKKTSLTK